MRNGYRANRTISSAVELACVDSSMDNFSVGYASDIEGGFEAWKTYLRHSSVLTFDESSHTIALKPNCCFIYGGDVCDRGSGDIRVLIDLLKLKDEHSDRVFFLIGNRDANKLRLPFSLHPQVRAHSAQAYWVTTGAEEGPPQDRVSRLKWILKFTMGSPLAFDCRREELQAMNRPSEDDDVVDSFLMLVTPGHPEAYLLRYLQAAQMAVIVEDALYVHGGVNAYYLGWVPPRLDKRIAPTAVSLCPSACTLNVFQWARELNAFADAELADYTANCSAYLTELDALDGESLRAKLWDVAGHYGHCQPGSRLVQCGMAMLPDKSDNPSVIYNSYLRNGEPVELAGNVTKWLRSEGITKVIVGHQPNGDAPFVMDSNGVQVVSADIAYSRSTMYPRKDLFISPIYTNSLPDGQGAGEDFVTVEAFVKDALAPHMEVTRKIFPTPAAPCAAQANTRNLLAVSEVCLLLEQSPRVYVQGSPHAARPSRLRIHGRLGQGSAYDCTLGEGFVGQRNAEGWYVKVEGLRLGEEPQSHCLLALSKGYDFKNRLVAEQDMGKEGFSKR